MANPVIIGIAGKKCSGKDTLADMLKNKAEEQGVIMLRRGLADALKEEAADFLTTMTNIPKSHWLECMHGPFRPEKEQLRLLMQWWGTEFRRKMWGENYWTGKLDEWIKQQTPLVGQTLCVVVPDIRFKNEADYVKSQAGLVIRILRPETEDGDTHISETELQDTYAWGFTLHNSYDIPYLEHQVEDLMEVILPLCGR